MKSVLEIQEAQQACDFAGQTKHFEDFTEAHHYATALAWVLGETDVDVMDDALIFMAHHDGILPIPN